MRSCTCSSYFCQGKMSSFCPLVTGAWTLVLTVMDGSGRSLQHLKKDLLQVLQPGVFNGLPGGATQ